MLWASKFGRCTVKLHIFGIFTEYWFVLCTSELDCLLATPYQMVSGEIMAEVGPRQNSLYQSNYIFFLLSVLLACCQIFYPLVFLASVFDVL